MLFILAVLSQQSNQNHNTLTINKLNKIDFKFIAIYRKIFNIIAKCSDHITT